MINDNIMQAVPVKSTLNDNIELKLYYDKKKKEYGYLGLYNNKCICAIGKVIKVVTVEKKLDKWTFDVSVTDDEKARIFEAMVRAKNYKYDKNPDSYNFDKDPMKFFFVDDFYPTNYITKGNRGILGSRKFDLVELLASESKTMADIHSTKDIADFLNGKVWTTAVNSTKSNAYAKLVTDVQKRYSPYTKQASNDKLDLYNATVNGKMICNEVNLWTYWQGFGYAEKMPHIKYLLVGQDWGNPFLDDNEAFVKRIIAMNNGDKNITYIDRNDKIYITDEHLIELFETLGYKDIDNKRYDDLFFTNFCLGYRSSKQSGSMTKEIMFNDADKFKKLCEILEPENILCLGRETFECVCKTFNINCNIGNDYNKYLDNHEDVITHCGNTAINIYPLAHCGGLGTANRSLDLQKQDWKKINNANANNSN